MSFFSSSTALDFKNNPTLHRGLVFSRLLFSSGVTILVAGALLMGNYENTSDLKTGSKLVKEGYFIIVTFVVCLVAFQSYF